MFFLVREGGYVKNASDGNGEAKIRWNCGWSDLVREGGYVKNASDGRPPTSVASSDLIRPTVKKVTRLLFFCTDIKGSPLCH